MKITFVCRGMGEGGGIQRVITELIHEIIKNPSVDELIIVSDNFDADITKFKKVKTVKIWSPANLLRKLPKYWITLFSQPIFVFLSTIFLYLKRKDLGVIFNHGCGQTLYQDVIVFHSCHHEWVSIKRKKRGFSAYFSPLDWFILICEKWNMRRSNKSKVISVSNFTKEQVKKHFEALEVDVIPNGVNTTRFSKNENKLGLRKIYNLQETDKIIVFVANEWKRKGLEVLVRVVSKMVNSYNNIKLVVAGRDLNGAVNFLKETYRIEDELIYLGEIKDIEKIYQMSDIFCLPTEEDAFGLVIGEAMSCGLPVVITDRCGIKDYIENYKSGVIVQYDNIEEELHLALETLLNDQEMCRKIGIYARKMIEKELSWKMIASKYVQLAASIDKDRREVQGLN